MCTNIARTTSIAGSAKIASGWIKVSELTMSFDHAGHLWVDHALRMDFVDGRGDNGGRVAIELDLQSARAMAERLNEIVSDIERAGVD